MRLPRSTARRACTALRRLGAAGLGLLLVSCDAGTPPPPAPHPSAGQVKPSPSSAVSAFAAARFADQVSFGATPALVAQIQARGFEGWIDAQFALPVSTIDAEPVANYDSQIPALASKAYEYANEQLYRSMLNAPDQLRRRVSWSLSQFITTSTSKVEPYGGLSYSNFLQQQAFGNYGELLKAVSINPPMGVYLDNIENRPTTAECTWCAPNENYARELLQLFTLGVVKLNTDGTVQRDGDGRVIETYTQKDVEELARALTGWRMPGNFDRTNFHRYDGTLVTDSGKMSHDRGSKLILGTSLPAGADAPAELTAIVQLLMRHQNIAPFVSLRLIQHHITSDPTPAYVERVASVFRNNGGGVAGDMKALLKAVLLDPEARRGDLAADDTSAGKMREPVLWYTSLLRGLGCTGMLRWPDGNNLTPQAQRPFDASSVFSYYMPTDRAPGSNLLAPEQRLLNAEELSFRMQWGIAEQLVREPSCAAASFGQAYTRSPEAVVELINARFFRGVMPALLRQDLITLAPDTPGASPDEKAVRLLQLALSSPYYGVVR